MDNLKKLKDLDHDANLLAHSIAVLNWDQETYMPVGAVLERSEQISQLEGLLHEKLTSDIWGELFNKLITSVGDFDGDYNEFDKSFLRESYRRYKRKTKLPVALVRKFASEVSLSQVKWVKARTENDFAMFAPNLTNLVQYSQEIAQMIGYDEHPYDALLDEYEPWMKTSEIKAVFNHLESGLKPLIDSISKAPKINSEFLKESFPIDDQDKFGRILQKEMGYDFHRGRLDLTAHPFSTTLGFDDIRITTHYNENDLLSGIFSNIHEAGHGQYEQGFDKDLKGSLLANGASMGIHESQSRFWENLVGRDINYWARFYPELVKLFPKQLYKISLSEFHRSVNKVESSLIRIKADEVTYSMHVILRFNLELDLISGKLAIKDLPDAWIAESERLLGITPQTYSEGVLQDIHWAAGLFGYFPTYALGNLYGAQFTHYLKSDLPSYNMLLMKGELYPVKNWLKENIHKYGCSKSASQLIEKISGEKLNPQYFLDYINNKYRDIYGI